jgi:hypothetical protein
MADEDTLNALKTAFTFMPQPVEINRFEYGEDTDRILAQVKFVREVLVSHGIDPDEVAGDINPDTSPNSCY